MAEQDERDEQDEYTPGWYGTLQEAVDAALQQDDVELGQIREIAFQGRKKNPIHEFRVKLRPPSD